MVFGSMEASVDDGGAWPGGEVRRQGRTTYQASVILAIDYELEK